MEDKEHFLLLCPRFSTQRQTLLDLVSNLVGIDICASHLNNYLLLYGNNDFSFLVIRGVIEETIKYIKIQSVLNEFEHFGGSH